MTVAIVPTGYCNIDCTYCFEPASVRKQAGRPDVDAIERSLDGLMRGLPKEVPVGLHGGECTMVPMKDLDRLLAMIVRHRGEAAVQTNGYIVTSELISLFQKHNTKVSISWDGPGELNSLRGPDPTDPESTRRFTEALARNVQRLREAGLRVAITVVLSKVNAATDHQLDRMKEWMRWLGTIGVNRGRVNPLFMNPQDLTMELSGAQLAHAYRVLFDFVVETGLEWLPFREMVDNLLGFPLSPCVYAGCNVEDTFVFSIFPDGRVGNCDRTFSNGMVPRPEVPRPNDRLATLAAHHCNGCKYWRVCHGGCPVHSIGEGDNITPRFCEADYGLYAHIESRLRGLLPNVRLVLDTDAPAEPFDEMSWSAHARPSSFRKAPPPVTIAPPSAGGIAAPRPRTFPLQIIADPPRVG